MAEPERRGTAAEAYDALAAAYAATVETKPHNAYYERPATLSLLPDIRGLAVLDAGCGAGTYSAWLIEHGADVVAFDASGEMVRYTRERLGAAARVYQADLGQPLAFLADATFDLVLCPLALDFVADWAATFAEFYRVLRPGGTLVFSVNHPLFDFLDAGATDYFATEAFEVEYGSLGAVRVPTFRRPLGALVNPLLAAGFELEQMLEPRPTPEFEQADPAGYARLMQRPLFLCVRARRRGETA